MLNNRGAITTPCGTSEFIYFEIVMANLYHTEKRDLLNKI